MRGALLACARAFAAQHGLTGGMGCTNGDADGRDCVVEVLANAFAQRRWLAVNEAGDLEE